MVIILQCRHRYLKCSRLFLHNSAHNIQIESIDFSPEDCNKKPLNIFLQEVNKCAETRATITRYKLSEPCLGLYPICLQNEKLCAINTHKYITKVPLPLKKQINEIYYNSSCSPILTAATCQCEICR